MRGAHGLGTRGARWGWMAGLVSLQTFAQGAASAPPPPTSSPAPVAAPAPAPVPAPPPPAPVAAEPPPVVGPATAPAAAAPAPAPADVSDAPAGSDRVVPRKTKTIVPKVAVGTALGTVIERKDGALVLETLVMVDRGMRVAFVDERGDEIAVGRITKINNRTFHVAVGVNEEIPTGATGYLTENVPTGSLEAPPQATYPLAFAMVFRPWLGLNTQESGVLIDAWVRVRLGDKAKLTMAVEPFAPPFGSVTGAVEAYVAPSISMKLAEIGFGIGVGSAVEYQGTTTEFGLLFSPILRIGAEDGLHLRARTSAVLSSGIASFGSFRAEGQIPLTHGLWLLLAGGGGQRSYAFGDIGLRLLMSGTGSRHSWFAKMLIGGAGATSLDEYNFRTNEAGPTFGLGIEGRL